MPILLMKLNRARKPWPQAKPLGNRVFGFTGTTRDNTGAALGGCTVKLYRERDDSLVAQTVSDANGNYVFSSVSPVETYYARFYLAGSPDKAGTTKNSLVPT